MSFEGESNTRSLVYKTSALPLGHQSIVDSSISTYYYNIISLNILLLKYIKINYLIIIMNKEELITEIKILKEENEKLLNELNQTRAHLKKYTAPIRNKNYYEENKEKHKQVVKEYKEKVNYHSTLSIEKKREYARKAYLNKKLKMNKLSENENI